MNVCLGTDSLATVYKTRKDTIELSMFDEMRSFAGSHAGVSPEKILSMATVNGARALGMSGQVGEISVNAAADLIALPFNGNVSAACDAVVQHRGNVTASMINGQWCLTPEAVHL